MNVVNFVGVSQDILDDLDVSYVQVNELNFHCKYLVGRHYDVTLTALDAVRIVKYLRLNRLKVQGKIIKSTNEILRSIECGRYFPELACACIRALTH
jgi:hypothetical protein